MMRMNQTRADYLAKFEELIESYNAGRRNIDELFHELVTLSQSLSEEQSRHVREQLSEEELTLFDILTRPGPELSAAERDDVKKVARVLLAQVKRAVVLDWRRKSEARARIRLTIQDALDDGLPRAYTPDLYHRKVNDVLEHVFESYPNAGVNVFTNTFTPA